VIDNAVSNDREPRVSSSSKATLPSRLGGRALYGLMAIAGLLPPRPAQQLGVALGRLLFFIVPKRRAIAEKNLLVAFPEKSEAERRRILRRSAENVGKSLVEFLRLPKLCRQGAISRLVRLEGKENLRAALAKGRGVIMITAHFGNWEYTGAKLAEAGFPITVLARQQRDSNTTRLINGIRQQVGMEVLEARNADSNQILKCLRENKIVAILIDQHAGQGGLFVDFFGRPASTHRGAALFALRARAPVIPLVQYREKDNTHVSYLAPELALLRTGTVREDIDANTALFTKFVEEQIRARPETWLWMHDRWRSAPPPEGE
jgi:Kdo2-lipid IVA lauroyltransferase/acyltransferase